jgi:hypothetical protein
MKNLLTQKLLLNVVSYYLPWWIVQRAVLKNAFYRVGQGGTGDKFMEPRGGGVARISLETTDIKRTHNQIQYKN